VALVGGAAAAALGLVLAGPALDALSIGGEARALALDYLVPVLLAAPLFLLVAVVNARLAAQGDTKSYRNALGSVDVLPQQDAGCGEMNEGEIPAGELVEAAEDAAEVFELAEQALDPGAFLVEVPVGRARVGADRMRWDDRFGTLRGDPGEDGVAVVGAIGEHRFDGAHRDRAEQGEGCGGVARLARGQREAKRVAEAVGEAVQLRGEPAP
jgi:hypothetical protein